MSSCFRVPFAFEWLAVQWPQRPHLAQPHLIASLLLLFPTIKRNRGMFMQEGTWRTWKQLRVLVKRFLQAWLSVTCWRRYSACWFVSCVLVSVHSLLPVSAFSLPVVTGLKQLESQTLYYVFGRGFRFFFFRWMSVDRRFDEILWGWPVERTTCLPPLKSSPEYEGKW